MKRRTFIKQSLALTATPTILRAAAGRKRPNVLLLFSDQHNASVLGCAGHPFVKTPNLDALASSGVRYRRAYCQDGICVPSRVSLFTGLYPRTTGCLENRDRPPMPESLHPLHKLLKANGYTTASIGKRHLPPHLCDGFDCTATTISPKQDPSDESYRDWVAARGFGRAADRDITGSKQSPLCAHISDLPPDCTAEAYTARRTMEFIRKAAASDSPFFCFCSFLRPHQPYTPVKKWADLYDPAAISLPESLSQPIDQLPPMMQQWRRNRNRPWCLADAAEHHEMYRNYVAYYYALVHEIDHHIGDIMRTLADLQIDDNTIVIYTADHGDFVAAHGMVEKCALGHNVYENTLAIPMIFRLPGHPKPAVRDDLVELIDLYPTLLQLLEIDNPYSDPLPGLSLVESLRTGRDVGRPFVVSENWSQLTVIEDRYKLGTWIEPPNPRFDFRSYGDMLFDRQADPLETNNLAGKPQYAEIEKRLRAHLAQWTARTPARAKELSAPKALPANPPRRPNRKA